MRQLIVLSLVLAFACGDDDQTSLDAGGDAPAVDSGPMVDAGDDAGPPSDAFVGDSGAASIAIRITASGDVFPHADLLSGQTARATLAGVRGLSLHRSMSDPDPLVLFRAEGADVEVGYVPGDNTLLTTVPASSLAPGSYTFARLVQTYARYDVDATLHRLEGTTGGVVSSFQVIANGTEVGGETYDAGHYELMFSSAEFSEEWTGEDGAFPDISATAGAIGIVEDGEWVVYFPIQLEIDEPPAESGTLSVEVNMFESFRWTDLILLGYLPGVFDVTALSFEPVLRFGGNAFEMNASF